MTPCAAHDPVLALTLFSVTEYKLLLQLSCLYLVTEPSPYRIARPMQNAGRDRRHQVWLVWLWGPCFTAVLLARWMLVQVVSFL